MVIWENDLVHTRYMLKYLEAKKCHDERERERKLLRISELMSLTGLKVVKVKSWKRGLRSQSGGN